MKGNTKNKITQKKKWIYISVGLAIFILAVAAGAWFFFWKKPKSYDKLDSTDKQDDSEFKDSPIKIKEWREKDWKDEKTRYSNYHIPPLPDNISVERAKEEVIEAIWQWGKKKIGKKKLERILEKNAQRINLTDKKEYDNKEEGPFGVPKFLKKLGNKYQKDVFFKQLDQKKFEAGIVENDLDLFYLLHSFNLKYKSNKEIDWQASFQNLKNKKLLKKKTKTQQEEQFQEINNYIAREVNSPTLEHSKKFPHLDSLTQLNNWVNTHNLLIMTGKHLNLFRSQLAKKMGKESLAWNETEFFVSNYKMKNEKFDLEFMPLNFENEWKTRRGTKTTIENARQNLHLKTPF